MKVATTLQRSILEVYHLKALSLFCATHSSCKEFSPHLRASFFIQFNRHQCRCPFLSDAWCLTLPEEVRTPLTSCDGASDSIALQVLEPCPEISCKSSGQHRCHLRGTARGWGQQFLNGHIPVHATYPHSGWGSPTHGADHHPRTWKMTKQFGNLMCRCT